MTLQDTIPMMTSSDFRERMKAEYLQLCIRAKKLQEIINDKSDANNSVIVLEHQLHIMIDYMAILQFRAANEGVALEEI